MATCKSRQPSKWQSLIQGKSIASFQMLQDEGEWSIQDGVLVGTSVYGNPSSYLCTKETYSDFILELDFKIDPLDRAWSGGFYEEGGRGWLAPPMDSPEAREAFKPEDWNHFRIIARGDTIKTWIKGVQAVARTDSKYDFGVIGFQLHNIYREEDQGKQVWFRQARIKLLEQGVPQ